MKYSQLVLIPAGLAAGFLSFCINACDKNKQDSVNRDEVQKSSTDTAEVTEVKDYKTDEEPGVLNGALPVEQKQDEEGSGSADESEVLAYFPGMPIPPNVRLPDDEVLTWYGPVIQGNSLDDPESRVRTLADYGIKSVPGQDEVLDGKPHVSAHKPVVTGRMDIRVVQKIVHSHIDELRACYEEEVSKDKELSGTVSVLWIINGDGTVTKTVVKETTLKNKKIESCITNSIIHWHFPAPKDGALVNVEQTLEFSKR